MGIRKYKPTTPGRRGSSVADFVEVTRYEPEKSLVRPLPKKGGREAQVESPRAIKVADTSAPTASSTSVAPTKTACQPRSRTSSTTRTAPLALRYPALCRWREALHLGANQAAARRSDRERSIGRHQAWQLTPAPQHPRRYRHPRRRATSRRRRQAGPLGRSQRPARRERRSLRTASTPVRRDPQRRRARRAPRSARWATPSSRTSTGVRPAECAGRASAQPCAVWP